MTTPNPDHPAKYSPAVLDAMRSLVYDEGARLGRKPSLLDPFAGVGRIHQLDDVARTVGVELEPEWAACHKLTLVGDATKLHELFKAQRFDVIATSPCYGNRTADHHNARDGSRRITYKHKLKRDPSEGSAAVMHWGHAYRELHELFLSSAHRTVKRGGLLIVNMSNHLATTGSGEQRAQRVQYVVEWWVGAVAAAGFTIEQLVPIETPRMRDGANADARVACEHLIVARRAA